jgi:[ribosomal protein S18]-alanine N-acetyltransferase
LRLEQTGEGFVLIAETGDETSPVVAGFVAVRRAADEAEVLKLAVDPSHQRQGIGRVLLQEACQRIKALGVRRVYLEVRASNEPAIRLYASTGFTAQYVRKDYYELPPEDAVVMAASF